MGGEEVEKEDEGKVQCSVQRKVLAANEIPPSSGDREKLPAANPPSVGNLLHCFWSGTEGTLPHPPEPGFLQPFLQLTVLLEDTVQSSRDDMRV